MKVKTTVKMDGINSRFSKRGIDKAKYGVLSQMQADMNKFVPYSRRNDRINLRGSTTILGDNSGIVYNTLYARRMYEGVIIDGHGGKHPIHPYSPGSKPKIGWTTPGTGDHWDEKAKPLFISGWTDTMRKGLSKYG